jgi:hypothetical protein
VGIRVDGVFFGANGCVLFLSEHDVERTQGFLGLFFGLSWLGLLFFFGFGGFFFLLEPVLEHLRSYCFLGV